VTAATATIVRAVRGSRALRSAESRRSGRRLDALLAPMLEQLARRLAAGEALRTALLAVADRGPEPLAAALAPTATEIRLGRRAADAFADFATRTRSDLFQFAAAALVLHQRRGGDVVAGLRRSASVVRERRAAALEVKALTAQARYSAMVLVAVPAATAFMVGGPGPSLPWPVAVAVTVLGWSLLGIGAWATWRLSSPREPAAQIPPVRASSAMVALGRHLPARVRRWRRTVAILSAGGEVPDAGRLASAALERVLCASAGVVVAATFAGPVAGCALGAGGWFVPELGWRRAQRRLRSAVEADLPQACDLIGLALGSGCDVASAVGEVAPLVGGECGARLGLVTAATAVGTPFDDALELWGRGVDSDALDEVVATLRAARREGGAAADTVVALGADLRLRNRLQRQAAARTLPVKVLFPLVFCVLPAFVLLTIVPMLAATLGGMQW